MTAIQQTLKELAAGRDLSAELMRSTMQDLMAGRTDPVQVGGFLMALRVKGETPVELAAAAQVMREVARRVEVDRDGLTDIVGTGGDGASLFNVSTASAFAAAAAGVRVAKHGGRSVSSSSGAADVLEAAGCCIDLAPEEVAVLIDEIGLGFMFAPVYHIAMKHAIGPRRALGLRTIFNLLGPLTNPAFVPNKLLGVFSPQLVVPMAEVLRSLDIRHALVVHSSDGLDEISPAAQTRAAELKNGQITELTIDPAAFGIQHANLDALRVENAADSLALIEAALGGHPGPAADMVALNTGAAIYVSGQAGSLESGVEKARQVLASGAGLERLKHYAQRSHEL